MRETRRDFLRVLGIGSAAAGLTGCVSKTPPDTLKSYVVPPEEMVRGHALWFRSTCRECPAGCGIEARVREGRVHKVEGNPEHPVNGGGLCPRGQAAVQGLYNPDRLRSPLARDASGKLQPVSWESALARVAAVRGELTMVTGVVAGPAEELIRACSNRWVRYEPFAYESVKAANRLCFGKAALPVLRFADARAICLFGTDVFETYVSPVGYARGAMDARRAGGRIFYMGSRLSMTGASADESMSVPPGGEGRAAMALVRELLRMGGNSRADLARWAEPFTAERAGIPPARLTALAAALRDAPALAVAGGLATCDRNALATAVAVNLLNVAAGAINHSVRFDRASALDSVASRAEMTALQAAMERGEVRALAIAGTNPVYSSPGFAAALRGVPLVVAMSSYADETVEAAHVVLPLNSPLETWDAYEPWTGVLSLEQPAMRPVFDTRDFGDILVALAKTGEPNYREYLRKRVDVPWEEALERGGHWRDVPEARVELTTRDLAETLAPLLEDDGRGPYRLQTYTSPAHFDGRGANRPWLQEIPDAITQAVWDSWVEINPRDASRLGVETGNRVRVRSAHGAVELPAYVYPGIAAGGVAIPLGQGHSAFGRYATGVGVNAAALLDPLADQLTQGLRWSGEPVAIEVLARGRELVVVGGSQVEHGREIARGEAPRHLPSVYPPHPHTEHRWEMVIDRNACTGCNACIAACYAENNVPVVGRQEVARGRLMSWIRLERFFEPGGQVEWTLMLCQQCDNAPCEPVCPVYAAYHNQEGLNGQVYNRCVGTRYCSNNCPYKVRRFNWFEAEWLHPLDWQLNPDVTVRSKGVMEKCTFCIQRIVQAKDRARLEGRTLRDGDVVPACAQSCPTQAIVFGDARDTASRVARLRAGGRKVLGELNTRPAVGYLDRQRRKV